MPVQWLVGLRFLELVFPPYVPHGWPNSKRATIFDWIDTVDWVRDKIDAPVFTLSLVMADFHGDDVPNLCGDLTEDQEGQIAKGYSSILHCSRPLAKDRSLANIHIQPAHPRRWTPGAVQSMQRQRNWLAETEQDIKKNAETFVFGGKPQESRNKAEPRKSTWQCWYEVEFTYSHIHWQNLMFDDSL